MSFALSCLMSAVLAAVSLQEETCLDVKRRLETRGRGLCRFVDYDANAPREKFVINTNFWLHGMDFSCVSPWNSLGGRTRAGTAISKRHIIFAKHFPFAKGTRILFTDGEIGTCPCRVTATRELPQTDVMIGLLDAELTPNIRPAKILPVGYEKWLPEGTKWPIVTFNQHEQAFLSEGTMTWRSFPKALLPKNSTPTNALWRSMGGDLIVGDSGDPAFLLVKGQPILLWCIRSGGVGFGPDISLYREKIQKIMDDLCPGYKLEEFDFGAL